MENHLINLYYLNFEILLLYIIIVAIAVYSIKSYFFKENISLYYKKFLFYIILLLIILLLESLFSVINQHWVLIYFFNECFIYNTFINWVKIFLLILLLLYFIYIYNYYSYISIYFFEFLMLILISFLGLCFMISSNHLFMIFLCLELVNLCIYCLIGLNKYSNFGIENTYKYFIQSATSTIIGFFALSIIYMSFGSLYLNELSNLVLLNITHLGLFGIVLLVLSFFFKLGLFPLHSWLGDVYQGSAIYVILYIATIPKVAYFVVLFKLLLEFSPYITYFCSLFSIITILIGFLLSLYQTNIRRLIGYGSMLHIGFITFSMCFFTVDSLSAAFFYIIIYILLIYFLFYFMLFFFEQDFFEIYNIENLSDLGAIGTKNTLLAYFLALILFSFAGLPFFMGFISKWIIFYNLILTKKYIELFLLLLISILSSVYYIRVIRFLFFFEKKENKDKVLTNSAYSYNLLILLILIIIINIIIIYYYSIFYLFLWKLIITFFSL